MCMADDAVARRSVCRHACGAYSQEDQLPLDGLASPTERHCVVSAGSVRRAFEPGGQTGKVSSEKRRCAIGFAVWATVGDKGGSLRNGGIRISGRWVWSRAID